MSTCTIECQIVRLQKARASDLALRLADAPGYQIDDAIGAHLCVSEIVLKHAVQSLSATGLAV